MGITYTFLKNASQKIKNLPDTRLHVVLLTLVAVTIPLNHSYNSIAVILFVAYSIITAKKSNIAFTAPLLVPVLLFVLMVLSLTWTIDFKATLKALGKEAPLLVIPIAFFMGKKLSRHQAHRILNGYSIFMCLFALYCMVSAIIKYFKIQDTAVFFYHELATKKLNAIYLSVLIALAIIFYLAKKGKKVWEYIGLLFLTVFLLLLSSKNVIITVVLLTGIYFLFSKSIAKRVKILSITAFIAVLFTFGYYGKIKERIVKEYLPNTESSAYVDSQSAAEAGTVYNVSIKQAWELDTFGANAYFNGTAFRVYQVRIFCEMLQEDLILFTGYGLNASDKKILQKGTEHNLYAGDGRGMDYGVQNFHNQYIQAFADLGIFGLLLVLILLAVNLGKAIKNKDFVHIAFAILMITLFLTESFLWRQRGVVFFMVFYCLFTTLQTKAIEKEI